MEASNHLHSETLDSYKQICQDAEAVKFLQEQCIDFLQTMLGGNSGIYKSGDSIFVPDARDYTKVLVNAGGRPTPIATYLTQVEDSLGYEFGTNIQEKVGELMGLFVFYYNQRLARQSEHAYLRVEVLSSENEAPTVQGQLFEAVSNETFGVFDDGERFLNEVCKGILDLKFEENDGTVLISTKSSNIDLIQQKKNLYKQDKSYYGFICRQINQLHDYRFDNTSKHFNDRMRTFLEMAICHLHHLGYTVKIQQGLLQTKKLYGHVFAKLIDAEVLGISGLMRISDSTQQYPSTDAPAPEVTEHNQPEVTKQNKPAVAEAEAPREIEIEKLRIHSPEEMQDWLAYMWMEKWSKDVNTIVSGYFRETRYTLTEHRKMQLSELKKYIIEVIWHQGYKLLDNKSGIKQTSVIKKIPGRRNHAVSMRSGEEVPRTGGIDDITFVQLLQEHGSPAVIVMLYILAGNPSEFDDYVADPAASSIYGKVKNYIRDKRSSKKLLSMKYGKWLKQLEKEISRLDGGAQSDTNTVSEEPEDTQVDPATAAVVETDIVQTTVEETLVKTESVPAKAQGKVLYMEQQAGFGEIEGLPFGANVVVVDERGKSAGDELYYQFAVEEGEVIAEQILFMDGEVLADRITPELAQDLYDIFKSHRSSNEGVYTATPGFLKLLQRRSLSG